MEKQGDLYATVHGPNLLAGKFSYHESGVTHHYTELVRRRSGEGQSPRAKLRGLRGHEMVMAFRYDDRLEATGYEPKPDTKIRRTLVVPRAEIGSFWFLWAIERGQVAVMGRIAKTSPWPTTPVVGTLVGDWSDPWLLVVVVHWTNDHPYEGVRYDPALPGRTPVEMIPAPYDGTWLESPGPKWRPGDPFPKEWIDDSREFVARKRRMEARRAKEI